MDPVLNRTRNIMLKTSQEQLWNNKTIKKREMGVSWQMLHGRHAAFAGQEAFYETEKWRALPVKK